MTLTREGAASHSGSDEWAAIVAPRRAPFHRQGCEAIGVRKVRIAAAAPGVAVLWRNHVPAEVRYFERRQLGKPGDSQRNDPKPACARRFLAFCTEELESEADSKQRFVGLHTLCESIGEAAGMEYSSGGPERADPWQHYMFRGCYQIRVR